jgi:hypothetical protein
MAALSRVFPKSKQSVIMNSTYLKYCATKRGLKFYTVNYQGTEFEFTVVQKLNHGSCPKKGCNFFRGSFLVTFLPAPTSEAELGGEAKSNSIISKRFSKNLSFLIS